MQFKRAEWIRDGHYDVEIKGGMQKGGIIMCKIKRADG